MKPRRLAIRSAASYWLGMSIAQDCGRGEPIPVPMFAPSPIAAHCLDSAADAGIDGACRDQAGDDVHGLLSRPALGIQGQAPGVVWQARMQPGGPGDVARLLASLSDAAASDLLDFVGRKPGALQHRYLGVAEQLRRVQAR